MIELLPVEWPRNYLSEQRRVRKWLHFSISLTVFLQFIHVATGMHQKMLRKLHGGEITCLEKLLGNINTLTAVI